MVLQPVFRGDPPVPLWIVRGGILVPAWADDPCDENCCEPDEVFTTCEDCLSVITGGLLTIAGCTDILQDPSATCITGVCEFYWTEFNNAWVLDEPQGSNFYRHTIAAGTLGDPGLLIAKSCLFASGGDDVQTFTHLTYIEEQLICGGDPVNVFANTVNFGLFVTETRDGGAQQVSAGGAFGCLCLTGFSIGDGNRIFEEVCNDGLPIIQDATLNDCDTNPLGSPTAQTTLLF